MTAPPVDDCLSLGVRPGPLGEQSGAAVWSASEWPPRKRRKPLWSEIVPGQGRPERERVGTRCTLSLAARGVSSVSSPFLWSRTRRGNGPEGLMEEQNDGPLSVNSQICDAAVRL